jgi:N-acetylglucosaminyldiphosphoundecaprenol N-acetyl-beta-D-mannosaminyltransferase
MLRRVHLFGVSIDALRMHEAVGLVLEWVAQCEGGCRFVVTPNVDHTVLLQSHEGLQRAYRDADLILADGQPVVIASRLVRKAVPERVPGSDLVPALFDAADPRHRLRVFLLGAAPGVADRAAQNIQRRWPAVQIVGTYGPRLGFEKEVAENRWILAKISAANPDVLIVGLGAPKQELWVHAHRQHIRASVALCVGATIDFLAGEKTRAPLWMRKVGLEWCHRMLTEPRRLAWRYARDAWIFPQLVWREWQTA